MVTLTKSRKEAAGFENLGNIKKANVCMKNHLTIFNELLQIP